MEQKPPRAVLWDMDGTLLDSAEYHWLAWRDTLAAEGHPITYEQFASSFGQRNDTILRGYFGEDLSQAEIDRIAHAKESRYRELVRSRGVSLLRGVQQWLDHLRSRGWRQAIASAAPRENIKTILEVLHVESYFDAMVSAEDVERGKPDPQVFLTAATQLDVPPKRCIVVEDAPAGIEAAHRAGMRAIGIRSSHGDLHAERVVDTLADLPLDTFNHLLEQE
jgi:beta-phosphoglucomutase